MQLRNIKRPVLYKFIIIMSKLFSCFVRTMLFDVFLLSCFTYLFYFVLMVIFPHTPILYTQMKNLKVFLEAQYSKLINVYVYSFVIVTWTPTLLKIIFN